MELETTGRLKEIEIERLQAEVRINQNKEIIGKGLYDISKDLKIVREGFKEERKIKIKLQSTAEDWDTAFNDWCKTKVKMASRTVHSIIQIQDRWGDNKPFDSFSKCIEVITVSDNDIKQIKESNHINNKGEVVKAEDLTVMELRQVVNEKKELQKALESKQQELSQEKLNSEKTIQSEVEKRLADERLQVLQEKAELKKKFIEIENKIIEVEKQKESTQNWLKNRERDIALEEKRIKDEKIKHSKELERLKSSEAYYQNEISKYQSDIDRLEEEREKVIQANKDLSASSKRYKDIMDFIEEMQDFEFRAKRIFTDDYQNELSMPNIKEKLLTRFDSLMDEMILDRNKISDKDYVEVI